MNRGVNRARVTRCGSTAARSRRSSRCSVTPPPSTSISKSRSTPACICWPGRDSCGTWRTWKTRRGTRPMTADDDAAWPGFETWHDRVVHTTDGQADDVAIDEIYDEAEGRPHT